jgi:hypothetical protein
MREKIEQLSNGSLMYSAILDKFERTIENSKSDDHAIATDAEVLLTNLWGIIHSHIHDFLTAKTTQLDNGYNSVRITDNTVDVKARTLPSQWGQQLMRDTIFSFDKDGHVQWTENGEHRLKLLLGRFDMIKQALSNKKAIYKPREEEFDLNTMYGLDHAKNDVVRIFNMLGITIDRGTLDQALKSSAYGTKDSTEKDRFTQFMFNTSSNLFGGATTFMNIMRRFVLNHRADSLDGLVLRNAKGEDRFVPTQQLYSENGFVKELANNYVQYHNNTDQLRAYAAGGNMLYPKSQNNFFTDRVSELNNSE